MLGSKPAVVGHLAPLPYLTYQGNGSKYPLLVLLPTSPLLGIYSVLIELNSL